MLNTVDLAKLFCKAEVNDCFDLRSRRTCVKSVSIVDTVSTQPDASCSEEECLPCIAGNAVDIIITDYMYVRVGRGSQCRGGSRKLWVGGGSSLCKQIEIRNCLDVF